MTVRIADEEVSFLEPAPHLRDGASPCAEDDRDSSAAHDEFEVIDWPGIFGVRTTPFAEAIDETFRHPRYSQVVLEF